MPSLIELDGRGTDWHIPLFDFIMLLFGSFYIKERMGGVV